MRTKTALARSVRWRIQGLTPVGKWWKGIHLRKNRSVSRIDEDIIDRIKSRLAGNDKPPRYPPTSEEILAKAEANLGFAIPPTAEVPIYAHAAE